MLKIGPKDFTSEQVAYINACKEQINEMSIKQTQIWNDLLYDKLKCYSITGDTILSERERDFLWDYVFNDTWQDDDQVDRKINKL